MRKFLLAALAALTLAGCQKNVSEPVKALIFTSEEPSTRTGWNGETIEWTAGDAISMAYSVNSSWVGPNLYPSDALTENSLTAAFRVPGNFPTDLVGAHHFYAVYCRRNGLQRRAGRVHCRSRNPDAHGDLL